MVTGRPILVVEDDDDVRETLLEILGEAGFACAAASDGAEGLAAARRLRPRLILLDVCMPVVDGWQFLSLRLTDPALVEIPVVVMTAMTSAQRAAAALAGPVAIIAKPCLLDVLIGVVTRFALPEGPERSEDGAAA